MDSQTELEMVRVKLVEKSKEVELVKEKLLMLEHDLESLLMRVKMVNQNENG